MRGCAATVYADSLSPISSDSYRFSDHPEYVAAYRAGLERLAALDCTILATPQLRPQARCAPGSHPKPAWSTPRPAGIMQRPSQSASTPA